MRRLSVLAVLLAFGSGAAADEYYIVQDISTKRCTLVDRPPASTEAVLLGKGRVYFERGEAERSLRSIDTCRSENTGSVNGARRGS
ncbi:MAG TPA: hypothetical protein VHG27_03830 [Xanthobacteraceae bacterium]|nr:hypothetical protein [Xanthobacteraceae bacterium]